MDIKEAMQNLKEFKVEYTGSGETVTYQSPTEGSRILEGETVRLFMS